MNTNINFNEINNIKKQQKIHIKNIFHLNKHENYPQKPIHRMKKYSFRRTNIRKII